MKEQFDLFVSGEESDEDKLVEQVRNELKKRCCSI
jgi:hypothetical protein